MPLQQEVSEETAKGEKNEEANNWFPIPLSDSA
jgi:hypothetical protein